MLFILSRKHLLDQTGLKSNKMLHTNLSSLTQNYNSHHFTPHLILILSSTRGRIAARVLGRIKVHTHARTHRIYNSPQPKNKGGEGQTNQEKWVTRLKEKKIKMLFDRQSWLYSKINNSIKCLIFFLCHPLLMSLQSLQQKSVIGCSK